MNDMVFLRELYIILELMPNNSLHLFLDGAMQALVDSE